MSYYTKEEVDFIKRTYENLNLYSGEYEATMTISCLISISIYIKNRWLENFSHLKIDNLNREIHGISKEDLDIHNKESIKNLKDIIWSLRNGVCHWNDRKSFKNAETGQKLKGIVLSKDENDNIKEIKIEGTLNGAHSVDIKFLNTEHLKKFIFFLQNKVS